MYPTYLYRTLQSNYYLPQCMMEYCNKIYLTIKFRSLFMTFYTAMGASSATVNTWEMRYLCNSEKWGICALHQLLLAWNYSIEIWQMVFLSLDDSEPLLNDQLLIIGNFSESEMIRFLSRKAVCIWKNLHPQNTRRYDATTFYSFD